MPRKRHKPEEIVANHPRVSVILPCLNEAAAIGDVIQSFQAALPEAHIYVVDNGSTDATASIAAAANARVIFEPFRGKGNAVRRAFTAIDSDIYVIADGDGTYDASAADRLINCLQTERLDMVVASRRKISDAAFRAKHEWGNIFFNEILQRLFGSALTDIFSGYRVFSRRYVHSFPIASNGFEIETEMTMHALLLRMPVREIPCDYGVRTIGTASKLSTWRDGWAIAWTIARFFRQYRPLVYFGVLSGATLFAALGLFLPLLATYLETGLVPRLPTLVVAVTVGIVGLMLATAGVLLDAIADSRLEVRRLLYLNAGN